jgi:hypothetical protein
VRIDAPTARNRVAQVLDERQRVAAATDSAQAPERRGTPSCNVDLRQRAAASSLAPTRRSSARVKLTHARSAAATAL